MTTISADVTNLMVKWADEQVKNGLYKSKSELVRGMFREKMMRNRYSALSEKALAKAWQGEDDNYWKSYL